MTLTVQLILSILLHIRISEASNLRLSVWCPCLGLYSATLQTDFELGMAWHWHLLTFRFWQLLDRYRKYVGGDYELTWLRTWKSLRFPRSRPQSRTGLIFIYCFCSKKSFSIFWTNCCCQSHKSSSQKAIKLFMHSLQIHANIVQALKCDGQRHSRCQLTVVSLSGLGSSSFESAAPASAASGRHTAPHQ